MYTIIKNDELERCLAMIKVKMNVQTAYHGKLLRKGKVYEVEKKTAERWIASKIAEKVQDNQSPY